LRFLEADHEGLCSVTYFLHLRITDLGLESPCDSSRGIGIKLSKDEVKEARTQELAKRETPLRR
jgi:hypothetical protein